MNAGHPKPEAATSQPPAPILEIVRQGEETPLLIPVLIKNLSSQGGVTVSVTATVRIADWDRYRGRDCLLHVASPGEPHPFTSKAIFSWSKASSDGRSPVEVGVQLINPPREALKRLSDHMIHTPPDIKGLWERYDQVKEMPTHSPLVHHFYIVGMALLVGGLALQFTGSSSFKTLGWVFWLLGSLGIAQKVVQSFRQKRVTQSPGGEKPRQV
ncbi:MAG: hypothetical protein WBV23_04360, partial [Desulfobaccales bacterium]